MTRTFKKLIKFIDEHGMVASRIETIEVPRLRTQLGYNEEVPLTVRSETNELPSQVQPSQTLSVKEIITKFVKGEALNTAVFEPVHDPDGDMSPFTPSMSPIEIMTQSQEIKQIIDDAEHELEAIKSAREAAEKQSLAKLKDGDKQTPKSSAKAVTDFTNPEQIDMLKKAIEIQQFLQSKK